MMRAAVLLAVAAIACAQVIPNEYIVKFNKGTSEDVVAAHMSTVRASGSEIMFEYNIGKGFRGYSIHTPENSEIAEARFAFLNAAEVEYFEPNAVVSIVAPIQEKVQPVKPKRVQNNFTATADCNLQEEATWGLVRVGQQALDINGQFNWNPDASGRGVYAYIIDTGIYMEHIEFERRVIWGFDAVSNPSPQNDPNGHGTHCAGTVMSKNFGVAKLATAVAVRVLGAGGSGSIAGVVAGVNYVAADARGKKAVASMSLGGGRSAPMNDAVAAAVAEGIPFVIAAGNNAGDACNTSPASEPTAITVMCSTNTDDFCSFSNWGTCAHIIAPGMSVTSTWNRGPDSINTISGTSMSTPHVAGAVCNILSEATGTLTPDQIKQMLVSTANQGYVRNVRNPTITPNALLYYPCD